MRPTTVQYPKSVLRHLTQVTLVLLAGLFVILVAFPFLIDPEMVQLQAERQPSGGVAWFTRFWLVGMFLFFSLWIFFFGSCLASFLNVVAWRLPRGQSLLGKSKCPNCSEPLSLKENMPVVGWLLRAGVSKCCNQPIPFRYVFVEILLGAICFLIGLVEIAGLGCNLPAWVVRPISNYSQIDFSYLALVSGHLVWVSLLFTFSLFRLEGDRIPVSIFVTGLAFFILQQGLFWFYSAGGTPCAVHFKGELWLAVKVTAVVLIGLAVAVVLGNVERSGRDQPAHQVGREWFFGLVLTGLFLDLDAMLWSLLFTLLLGALLRLAGQVGPRTGWLAPSHRLLVSGIIVNLSWCSLTLGDLAGQLVSLAIGN